MAELAVKTQYRFEEYPSGEIEGVRYIQDGELVNVIESGKEVTVYVDIVVWSYAYYKVSIQVENRSKVTQSKWLNYGEHTFGWKWLETGDSGSYTLKVWLEGDGVQLDYKEFDYVVIKESEEEKKVKEETKEAKKTTSMRIWFINKQESLHAGVVHFEGKNLVAWAGELKEAKFRVELYYFGWTFAQALLNDDDLSDAIKSPVDCRGSLIQNEENVVTVTASGLAMVPVTVKAYIDITFEATESEIESVKKQYEEYTKVKSEEMKEQFNAQPSLAQKPFDFMGAFQQIFSMLPMIILIFIILEFLRVLRGR